VYCQEFLKNDAAENVTMTGLSKNDESGFTLVELLITLVAGSIVVLGVFRLLNSSLWSYSLQEQMTDMYQNATYTSKRISEELAQAGADLPDTGYNVISIASKSDFTLRVNKRGARQKIAASISSSVKIPVDSGGFFLGCDSIVVDTGEGPAVTRKIDSVKVTSTPDTVYIPSSTTISLKAKDIVYGASNERFYLNNKDFCVNSNDMVLAENISVANTVFFDNNHVQTTNWDKMVSCSLYVCALTASKDPKYKHPIFSDGFRRLPLTINFRLRNRFK
jgi:prepilin-type N-terminal cleavage/methylation domain-containing protein